MNYLIQTGLRGLGFAREQVRIQAAWALAIAGFAAGTLTVLAGGRVGTVASVIPLTNWLGLFSVQGLGSRDYLPGALMLAGIIALVGLWLLAIGLHHSGTSGTERSVWWIAGAWLVPFALGPPMLSNDVWTYAHRPGWLNRVLPHVRFMH